MTCTALCVYTASAAGRKPSCLCEVRLAASPQVLLSRIGKPITMEEGWFPRGFLSWLETPRSPQFVYSLPMALGIILMCVMGWCHH